MARRPAADPARCLFTADPGAGRDHQDRRYCTCGLVETHPAHQLPDAPPAQGEHRARYDHDEEDGL